MLERGGKGLDMVYTAYGHILNIERVALNSQRAYVIHKEGGFMVGAHHPKYAIIKRKLITTVMHQCAIFTFFCNIIDHSNSVNIFCVVFQCRKFCLDYTNNFDWGVK